MDTLTIEIEENRASFMPGQVISGTAQWRLPETPDEANLQLLWYTEGKGDEDVGLVKTVAFDNPQASDNRRFELQIPIGPHSFSGKLISLIWGLELTVDKECTRKKIMVSPDGNEILLSGIN